MAKLLEDKLTKSKPYIKAFGEHKLSQHETTQLYLFNQQVGYTADRVSFLICCISLEIKDWTSHWTKLKSLVPGTLEYYKTRYGEEGESMYIDTNRKKTKNLDHSSEAQRKRALKLAEVSKGNKEWSVRGIGFWLKKGYSAEAAREKVKKIQATNTLEKYINKYGQEEGEKKFQERKSNWSTRMSDPIIGKKRSLGLNRYVERYGDELGPKKYLDMRKKRNDAVSIGRGSKESINVLSPIIDICRRNSLSYYLGEEGNKEWHIYDKENNKIFFYDMTIPTLSMIIEYHGEAFHPNPNWESDKLSSWQQLFTNKSALEVLHETKTKNKVAVDNGWKLYEVYSSASHQTIPTIVHEINQLGYF